MECLVLSPLYRPIVAAANTVVVILIIEWKTNKEIMIFHRLDAFLPHTASAVEWFRAHYSVHQNRLAWGMHFRKGEVDDGRLNSGFVLIDSDYSIRDREVRDGSSFCSSCPDTRLSGKCKRFQWHGKLKGGKYRKCSFIKTN